MAKTTFVFGSTPLHLTDTGDAYRLDAGDVPAGADCGITETFPKERYSVMEARATAYGYTLEVYPLAGVEPADASAAPAITLTEWGG